jgi:hypothetical protein
MGKQSLPVVRLGAIAVALAVGALLSSAAWSQQRFPTPPPTPAVAAARAAAAAAPQYATSEEQYAALKAKAKGHGARIDWRGLPDWSGVWESANLDRFDGVTPNNEGSNAPLKPEFVGPYKALLAKVKEGVSHDHLTACLPSGFPRSHVLPFYTEFTLTPDRTLWIVEVQGEVRRIYTDGRGHISEDDAYPLWSGDAIGFWDGDSLVVHTKNLRAYDSGYQRFGPPQSEEASTVEIIRRANENEMIAEVTVYDPKILTRSWRSVHSWRRVQFPGARIDTWSCAENTNAEITEDGGTRLILPGEKGSGIKGNK